MEDWALIQRLSADGLPQAQIAAKLGLSRNTVARAVAAEAPPKYERGPVSATFTACEGRVRALLAEYPQLPATVLAERVGWSGSITWFRRGPCAESPRFADSTAPAAGHRGR